MEIGFHTFPTSGKQYVFVKEPGTRSRIFLRNIIFLQRASNPRQFAIVREWGAPRNEAAWEPPKGQMEWKEFSDSGVKPGPIHPKTLARYMREGVLREMAEEAKVFESEIRNLRMLPLAYDQAWDDAGTPWPARFRYQFWSATMSDATMLEAQKRLTTLVKHPDLKHMLAPDVLEKDAIIWWSGDKPRDWELIRGTFSKKMTRLFVDWFQKHGLS
jgi:hypothetical protein